MGGGRGAADVRELTRIYASWGGRGSGCVRSGCKRPVLRIPGHVDSRRGFTGHVGPEPVHVTRSLVGGENGHGGAVAGHMSLPIGPDAERSEV